MGLTRLKQDLLRVAFLSGNSSVESDYLPVSASRRWKHSLASE